MKIIDFISEYQSNYVWGLSQVSAFDWKKAIDMVQAADKIYVGGNGGSASISNHLCCDFYKGANLRPISLSSNLPLITAIANDIDYDQTISYQLEGLCTQEDLVILISSSGNSPNIVRAANAAHRIGTPVLGLCGFDGGALKELSDVALHVPIHNYGVVEDAHQSIMHIIAQYIANKGEFRVGK